MSTASRRLDPIAGSLLALAVAGCVFAGEASADEAKPPEAKPPEAKPPEAKPSDADKPIRPPPFKEDIPTPAPDRVRHIEIGVHMLTISRPAMNVEGVVGPNKVNYSPTLGIEAGFRFPIFKYLQAGAFITGGRHHIDFSPGALGVNGTIASDGLTTIWFGLKAFPTLPIGKYVRLFGVAGVAWGRFEFPQMVAQEPGRAPFTIKGRGSSFVTFPLGLGSSFEVIKNWLSVDLEFDFSPNLHKDGTSFIDVQALDNGAKRHVGPLSTVPVTYTQSLGLSLLL